MHQTTAMVEELANIIDDFPGPANQTRCFLHVLNLVVKSIMRQFDLLKSKKTSGDDDDNSLDQAMRELLSLVGDINLEEQIMADGDEADDDDDDRWIDKCEEMTEDKLKELADSVGPVRWLLTKVNIPNILIYYLIW